MIFLNFCNYENRRFSVIEGVIGIFSSLWEMKQYKEKLHNFLQAPIIEKLFILLIINNNYKLIT
jgi:hypothetical protein